MQYSYEKAKEVLSAQGGTVWAEALMWAIDNDISQARATFEHSHGPEELLHNQGLVQGKLLMRGVIFGLLKSKE